MKELVMIIRPERLEDIKNILDEVNCGGMTLSTVMGCGTQKGIDTDQVETVNEIRGFKTTINLLPFQGGVAAMAVNTAKVDQKIDSYGDLFDPTLSGSLVVLDDYRAVIGMTARSMGYSMNEKDPAVLIKSILNDENRIIPVSTLLEGEYGERDVYAGVPVVLNRSGASDVLEIHMTPGELARFKESVGVIREYTEKLLQVE